MTEPIEVVLFDMGGVLVELGNLVDELGVSDMTLEEFWGRWLASPVVREFERGDGSVDAFADGLIDEFSLPYDRPEVIRRFVALARGLYPGAVELVQSVPSPVRTGVLSNTNELHWCHQPDNEIIRGLFDINYISYQIGLLKPDRDLFDHVVTDLAVPADRVLFIDDNQVNVDGALSAGLRSKVAKGPQQAAVVLADFGVISSG